MAGCGICGAKDQFLYRCDKCRGQYCQDHQPPTEHACPLAPDAQAIFSKEPAPAPDNPEPAPADTKGGPSAMAQASELLEDAWTRVQERAVLAIVAVVLLGVVAGGAVVAFQPVLNDALPFGFGGDPQVPENAVPAEAVNESEVGRMVASLVNDHRSEQGVAPLAYDAELAEIAKYHSDDMASEEYVGHAAPDGETVVDRFEQFGYGCGSPGQLVLFTQYASHVRTQNGTIPIYNEPQLGVGIFELWLESTDQRNALLKESWDNVGVGITITDENLVYVTLNAC